MSDTKTRQPGLLAFFAHPDDEAFMVAGTLARYAAQGYRVGLICATRGEVGEISDPALATPATLGAVREGELRQAAAVMGLTDVIFLDYRDSGMADTEENNHPDAFMKAAPDQVVARLVEIIREWQPQVIMTFEPAGGYGHPDHIAIHHHTTAAFFAARSETYRPELGPAWAADRFFHTSMARKFFTKMRAELEKRGEDTSDFDQFDDRPAWPGQQPVFTIDVSDRIEQKWETLMAHRTQLQPGSFFFRLPDTMTKSLLSWEYFVPVYPPDLPPATDLFFGLNNH